MSDQANNEPFWFREEKKRIVKNFIDQESKHKTLEDDAKDAANWLAQLSHLSQNITKADPESGGIDAKTSLKLRSFETKNPRDAVAQIILNKMGHNPLEALELFQTHEAQKKEDLLLKESQNAEETSLKMSNIAKKPRPEARKIFSEAITRFVSREPQITPKELLQRFKDDEDFEVGDELITHITECDVMKITALSMRLSRAKKKQKKFK